MKQIDFAALQADDPGFAPCWRGLEDWFAKNWRKRFVEWPILKRATPVSSSDLGLAMSLMVEAEMLRPVLRLRAPHGYLLEREFEQYAKLPKWVQDRDGGGRLLVSECEFAPGYAWDRQPAVVAAG